MTVSGLVVTWADGGGPEAEREGVRRLAAEPGCTPGERHDARQAFVLESATPRAAAETFRRIAGWPGVADLHVACVYLDEDDDVRPLDTSEIGETTKMSETSDETRSGGGRG